MATELSGFTVYVRREVLDALKASAAREGRTLSNYAARILEGLWHPQDGMPLVPERMGGVNSIAETTRPASRNARADLPGAIASAVKRGHSKAAKRK
jgi:hypothetical protein